MSDQNGTGRVDTKDQGKAFGEKTGARSCLAQLEKTQAAKVRSGELSAAGAMTKLDIVKEQIAASGKKNQSPGENSGRASSCRGWHISPSASKIPSSIHYLLGFALELKRNPPRRPCVGEPPVPTQLQFPERGLP